MIEELKADRLRKEFVHLSRRRRVAFLARNGMILPNHVECEPGMSVNLPREFSDWNASKSSPLSDDITNRADAKPGAGHRLKFGQVRSCGKWRRIKRKWRRIKL